MQQAEQDLRDSLAGASDPALHARTKFDCLDKRKLRDVLYVEQRHICVYCERKLDQENEVPPIEHWRPLRSSPDLALCWDNLYLSCATIDTCDSVKGHRRLAWDNTDPDLPWPTAAPYQDWVGFTSGGEAYVCASLPMDKATRQALELALSDQDDGAKKRKSILNLNHPALVAARKAAIDAERARIERDFADRHASADERQALADAMLRRRSYPAFVSIRVAWLRRTLGKNR